MKLLLTVCLTCALLNTAKLLRCHVCDNKSCTNLTSVVCPFMSTVCRTINSVRTTGSSNSTIVNKNCSSLLSCITPLNSETEWSVNLGHVRDAHKQMCCITDNCNFKTLSAPDASLNGKQCTGCTGSADDLSRNCSTIVSCMGNENNCFTSTTTVNSTEERQVGCMSTHLCAVSLILEAQLGARITCAAPFSIRISTVLPAFTFITAQKVLV